MEGIGEKRVKESKNKDITNTLILDLSAFIELPHY